MNKWTLKVVLLFFFEFQFAEWSTAYKKRKSDAIFKADLQVQILHFYGISSKGIILTYILFPGSISAHRYYVFGIVLA